MCVGSKSALQALLAAIVLGTTAVPDAGQAAVQGAGDAPLVARLETVAWRLGRATAERCAVPLLLTGMTLNDLAQFAPDERARVAASAGIGRGFRVGFVVRGAPAERAGLHSGDEIVALAGEDLEAFRGDLFGRSGSFARVEAFTDRLDQVLRAGPAMLGVKRAGAIRAVTLAGEPGCGGRMVLMPGSALNAWSDGHYVAVTRRTAEFVASDDELAFVVAHEMAHVNLRHVAELDGTSPVLAELGIGAGRVRRTEIEADAEAVRIMIAGGYDAGAAERFLRHAGRVRFLDLSLLDHRLAVERVEMNQRPRTRPRTISRKSVTS